jgi:thiol-disulfide isomerase/thioredoxin
MLYKFFLFLTLTLLVSTVLSAQIEFRTEDYEAAVADAKAQNKMLFIDFRADWCKPCREMEQTTFQDPTLSEYVHSKYIPVKSRRGLFLLCHGPKRKIQCVQLADHINFRSEYRRGLSTHHWEKNRLVFFLKTLKVLKNTWIHPKNQNKLMKKSNLKRKKSLVGFSNVNPRLT